MKLSSIALGIILAFSSFVASAEEKLPKDIQSLIKNYSAEYGDDYKIGVDDRIRISVWRNPDLSSEVPVRPDGRISSPLIGDVYAAGLTPEQLAQLIKVKLSDYVRDPQVSVILTGLNSNEYLSRVRIIGSVQNAQSLTFRKGMTVIDLVLAAGGLDEFAAANRATLYRINPEDGSIKNIKLKLKDLMKKGKLEQNRLLAPGDVISVPERLF